MNPPALDALFPPPVMTCDVCGKSFTRRPYYVLIPTDQYGDPIGQNMALCSAGCLRYAPPRVDRSASRDEREGTGWAA